MDLKSLKRKELQALCKKHGIPANSTNVEMIVSPSSIFENHDKVKPKACLKGSGGGGADDLGDVGGNLRKKVTFVVVDKEDGKDEEIARNPVGNSKGQSVENEVVGIKRRSTRSSGLADVLRSPVTEKTKKKSMDVGTEGVRRNDKPILSEVPTTRSSRNRVVVAGRDEDLVTDQNSRRSQKRNSIAEKKVTFVTKDEEDDVSEEITRVLVGNSKRKSDVNDVLEIEKRSTRSCGLGEAVLWSPGIEKKKKKSLRDGSEGVQRIDKPISSEVPAIRSLRNRTVVVGGEEELANDLNSRKNQKRKISNMKEENEMVASKLEGDEFVGMKNPRKRSRGGDFVGDEASNRMSSRNHAKSEENVSNLEEVDLGRSMKRRKRDTDGLITGEEVNENIDRANGTKVMVVNSNAVESIDVNNAEGQKKVQSRGKARKRGGRSKVVILPARRSTRSSSLVGKTDEEVEAVKEGKLQKHVKDGADGVFVSEPERSSTQSSSALPEHGTSLPVTRLPVEAAKGHGLEGVEVTAEPSWRSTRSSSVVGKSDEEGHTSKKVRSQKGGLPNSEFVAEPTRRSTRASSAFQEDGVAKPAGVGEGVKKSKSQKQATGHGSKGGGSTTSLQDSESIAEPVRRSTRSSSSLLENETSLPVVDAVKRVKSRKPGKDRALKGQAVPLSDNEASPIRNSAQSALKLSEDEAPEIGTLSGDEEAIKNKNPGKQHGVSASKLGDPTAFLPENETLTELEMRSTHDSPKLLDGEAFSPVVEGNTAKGTGDHVSKTNDHATAISTRRSTRGSSKLLKDGSVRRSTRGSMKHISLEVESSPVERKKTRKVQREDDLGGQRSDIRAKTNSLEEHEQSKELRRKSLRSTSKKNVLGGDKVEDSKLDEAISVSDPPIAGISLDLSTDVGSGDVETESNDAVDKNVHEIRQSLSSALPVNFEGSSEVEVNISNLFPTEPSSTVEVNSEQAAPSKISEELSATFETDISPTVHHDNIITGCEMMHVSSSPAPKNSEELSIRTDSHTSLEIDLQEPRLEAEEDGFGDDEEGDIVVPAPICVSSEELILTAVTKADPEIYLKEPDSNVEDDGPCEEDVADDGALNLEEPRLEAEIRGACEDGFGYAEETDIVVPTPVCISSEELVPTSVTKADPEIYLKEPESKVEDDGPCEDVVADDGALNIFDPLTSKTEVCFDSHTSHKTCLEEPRLKLEICGADEDGLQDDEEKDILIQTSACESSEEPTQTSVTVANPEVDFKEPDSKVELELEIFGADEDGLQDDEEKDILIQTSACESSEELTQTPVTVANPEVDLKEPDSKVEVDPPREDATGDFKAKKIFDPLTSDTGVCSETLCDINVVGSDSKVEVHDASEGDMQQNEGYEATTAVSSVMSCTSTGITSLNEAYPHSDVGQVDIPAMNKEASHSEGFLTEASDIHLDGNPGDTSSPQTIYDNEMENCKAEPDIILKSPLENRECDIINNIEAVTCEYSSLKHVSLEVESPPVESEKTMTTHPKEPDSKVIVGIERDNIITGCEKMHVSSSLVPKISEELSPRTDSHTSLAIDLEEPRLEEEIRGASADGFGHDEETDIAVPTPVCKSSEEPTLTDVTKADPGIYPKEPVSKVEDDGPCEDVVADDGPCGDVAADDGALNVFDPLTSDTEVCSDSHTCHGTCLEEPVLKGEICGADEDGLPDDEEKDILIQTSACEISEELAHTSVTVANPEVDLDEPDSKVEVVRPREDVIGNNEAKKIFDPMASYTEVCSETLCDVNVVGSDSKVEVHDASKGDMEENEATHAVSSVMSCKPTRILSPTSLNEASPHSDLGQVEIPAMNEEASHSDGFLTEASDFHCKTLEVSMTVDRNPGDTSSPQTSFDNEMENCKANQDRECDIINNIEAVICDELPRLSEEDLDVMKETRALSTVSVTVTDGTEVRDDREDAEKNKIELRSSLPMDSHAEQSLSEELVDAEQSDFTHGSHEKESGDAEKKLRVSVDEEFSAENNNSLQSPAVFMKSEGTSYAAPLEHKDEPSAIEFAEVSTEITEDRYYVEHGESEKQMEDDYKLCDADVESKGYSASSNENTSLTDAVLFEDVKNLVDHDNLPGRCGEEMPLCGIESPTLSGNEGLTLQVDIQGFSSIHDIEDERNLSDHQEGTINVSESLGIDIVDGSKSAAKKHVYVEQPNANSGPPPETSIIVNKLTDVEFERTTELDGMGSEEMDNIGSLERDVDGEGCDGSKEYCMEPDKVDLLDYVGQKRDNASLLQEINHFSGELHADETTSHTSLSNSASESEEGWPACESAEGWVLPAEKISPSACLNNDTSLPKMDRREEQLDGDSSEKTSAEDGTPYGEEFLSTSNFIPLADHQECQDNNLEEHAVDNDIDMSGMDHYFGDLDDHSNKFQGTYDDSFFTDMFEDYEQASISNADEACVAHCEALTEKSFHMNAEEKGVVPGRAAAGVEEPSPLQRENFPRAENFSSASSKNFAGLVTQEQHKQKPHDQTEDGGEWPQNPSYY